MKNNYELMDADLSLFEGGEGGASASGDSMGEGITNDPVNTQPEGSADTRAENGDDTQSSQITLEEKRKAYNDLIRGEYKDFYTEDTQKMIDRRFKETKNLEKKLAEHEDIMGMLMQRYGVDDASKLEEAIMNDDGYWEQAAFEAGMSVDQYKAFSKLERENKALLQAQAQRQNEERANRQLEQWFVEAEALKEQFADFDLEQEVTNPEFIGLLKANVPMEHAYKLIHMDEIMNNAVRTTAAEAEQRTVANIRARGQRPAEAGTSYQSAFTTKKDVHALTPEERAEIVKRAARGEQITFN